MMHEVCHFSSICTCCWISWTVSVNAVPMPQVVLDCALSEFFHFNGTSGATNYFILASTWMWFNSAQLQFSKIYRMYVAKWIIPNPRGAIVIILLKSRLFLAVFGENKIYIKHVIYKSLVDEPVVYFKSDIDAQDHEHRRGILAE